MPEVDRVLGNEEKLDRATWAGDGAARRRRRHHGGRHGTPRMRSTASKAIRAPSCRCRTAATTAARSASFRSAAAIRARCRWMTCVAQARRLAAHGYRELVLTGVDITSYGADLPARRGSARWSSAFSRRCRSWRGCGCRRSIRWRPMPICSMRLANEPRLMPHLHLSLQSGDDLILKRMKRRHTRARRHRVLRPSAPLAARCRLRRRHHRRLPDRDRGHVRALARSGGRMRADAAARLSVLAAARHAGRAHAAARPRDRQGARPRACAKKARRRCARISTRKSARGGWC